MATRPTKAGRVGVMAGPGFPRDPVTVALLDRLDPR